LARQLIYYPDPVLRVPAKKVSKVTVGVRGLIRDMIEVMAANNGMGLAASQVGVPLQVFVADVGEGPFAVINPKVVRATGEHIGLEGCLSFPRLYGDVARAKAVTVRGLDSQGKKVSIEAEDLLARVLQHEIDHLKGTLFTDKVDPATVHWLLGYDAETGEPIKQPAILEDALRVLERAAGRAGERPLIVGPSRKAAPMGSGRVSPS
jgi:peptide deformylase